MWLNEEAYKYREQSNFITFGLSEKQGLLLSDAIKDFYCEAVWNRNNTQKY